MAYEFAKQLAAGHTTVSIDPDTWTPEKSFDEIVGRPPRLPSHECLDYARFLEFVRNSYPSIVFVPSNSERYERSYQRNQALVTSLKSSLRTFAPPRSRSQSGQVPTQLIPGSLYEAFDTYCKEDIDGAGARLESGKLKVYQRKRLEQVARLKRTHADIPLFALTFDKCKEMVAVWRNRPKTQKGTQSTRSDAKNHLGQLRRFFTWLDLTGRFEWTMPKGVASFSCKISKFDNDRQTSVITVEIYTPAQLAAIITPA